MSEGAIVINEWDEYYEDWEETNPPSEGYTSCKACYGTGIDPASKKSYMEDEYDCMVCQGYGEIPEYNPIDRE